MRSTLILMFVIASAFRSAMTMADDLQSADDTYFEINGLVYVKIYDKDTRVVKAEERIPEFGLKFYVIGRDTFLDPNSQPRAYVLIRFYEISKDNAGDTKLRTSNSLLRTNQVRYVTSDDNLTVFAIPADEFANRIQDGFIHKRHTTWWPSRDVTYGGNLTIPFKYRLSTKDKEGNNVNVKISPEVTLGGFIGARFRISATREAYLSPVLTLGLGALPINDDVNNPSMIRGDGTVLGVTAAIGALIEIDGFQVGAMVGVDKASGQYASDWIYDKKPWFSFSIGYAFIAPKKDDPKTDVLKQQ